MQRFLLLIILLFAGSTAAISQPNAWTQDTSLHAGTGFITSLLRPSNGGLLLAVDASGLFRSEGSGWLPAPWPSGVTSPYVLHEVGPDTLLVGTAFNGIYRSTDRGGTWRTVTTPSGAVMITHILDHNGTLYASATDGGLRSTDRGATWSTVLPIDQVLQFERTAAGALISAHVGRSSVGSGHAVGELLRSTDDGATWEATQHDSLVTTVAAAPDGRLYCGGYGVFGRSTDDGEHWAFLPLADRVVRLGFAPDGVTVYAATRHGLIKTSDQGATWQTELAADSIGAVTMLSIPSTGTWYAGDEHGRLFSRTPAITSAPNPLIVASGMTATPNPASTYVRFRSADDAASLGALTVISLNGRTVLSVGAEQRGRGPAGEILLDVRALPAGIYLYRVVDGGKTTAGSFAVVR